ncbi:TetR/AcrR family transcriptional regulator C-terminal domain-containing protein [Pseudohoeflea coraliihabitans]|uniref:TetR/AcrR family transcriptional regulator C-terminal domain-containing protein n=1 Tax=Pseudohoeflea coraliihabitans TaxID=2860393 RepID=A0ABS6WIU7_9HYPH|nr:TetR/AcrR family transcriptional regulator C-terminal domain-containing protein [Pseudohoeflea sp. DP4N28-3]MBW3095866.1 TetR/AcrR family transcriptional regulator C-terminal domain-containing protein [Pseudohoeflea sp. DP4N28-3]
MISGTLTSSDTPAAGEADFTPRQREVLDVVLQLMVEEGDGFSVARIAQAASCSKETLYKWFGDRDGILTATVRWQAARVRAGSYDRQRLDEGQLRKSLADFAANWLTVISSPTSIALNRVAVSHAGSGKSRLGAIVLANGRLAIGERLKPLLEAGRDAGLLDFGDTEAAFRTFFGLVGRDVQIRLLLGETVSLPPDRIAADAALATQQFLTLYGVTSHSGSALADRAETGPSLTQL